MSSCPVCQTELPDDFGLIDCPGCQAPLFIEMDGTVKSSSPEGGNVPSAADEIPFEDQLVNEFVEEPESYEEPEPYDEPEAESPAEFEPEPEMAHEPEEGLDQYPDPEPLEDFEEPQNQGPDEPLIVSDSVPDQVAEVDISQLANAMDERGAVEGLLYDLQIAGIDSADLRREVYEAFIDKKLGWNAEEVMETVKNGVLELTALSAIKTQVIVQRLKTLPLQIRWSQYGDS